MIEEIHLVNWKSIKDSVLYIDPITALIGTNASGKSNFLEAIITLSSLSKGRPVHEVIGNVRGGKDSIIRKGESLSSLSVKVKDETVSDVYYVYAVSFQESDGNVFIIKENLDRVKKTAGGDSVKSLFSTMELQSIESPTIDVRFFTGNKGRMRRLDLGRSTSILSQVDSLQINKDVKSAASIVVGSLSNVFMLNPIPDNMRGYMPLSVTLNNDASNMAGVLSALDPERRKLVESKLTEFLKPLPEQDINRVWTERVGLFQSDAMLYCEEQWIPGQSTIVDARTMSDGTLRFLAIVTAILTMRRGGLLIVEEIDNGLHPSRAKELVRVLKTLGNEQRVDILFTTHNPVLVDQLGIEMLPFVFYIKRDPTTGASVVLPLEEHNNLIKLMSSYSMGDLMVEDKL